MSFQLLRQRMTFQISGSPCSVRSGRRCRRRRPSTPSSRHKQEPLRFLARVEVDDTIPTTCRLGEADENGGESTTREGDTRTFAVTTPGALSKSASYNGPSADSVQPALLTSIWRQRPVTVPGPALTQCYLAAEAASSMMRPKGAARSDRCHMQLEPSFPVPKPHGWGRMAWHS